MSNIEDDPALVIEHLQATNDFMLEIIASQRITIEAMVNECKRLALEIEAIKTALSGENNG
jgi:hypothetical protein